MTIEAALRHYLRQQTSITDIVDIHIYAGRIPQGERPVMAIKIMRLSTERYYALAEELGIVSPIVELEFVGRDDHAAAIALRAAEAVRLKVSSFKGVWGPVGDQITVNSCTVERDVMAEPVWSQLGDDRWTFTYSMDLRITHQQTAIATP